MKKALAMLCAVALMVIGMVGCSSNTDKTSATSAAQGENATAAGTIKIGGIGPLTGSAAAYGLATRNGAQIAIDEINALGGLQFEMNFQDDEADGEKGVNAYNALQDWGMQVLYGCTTTGSCVAVAGESYKDRYFQITASASSTDVTAGNDNVFQVCFTDPNQGKTAADYVAEKALAKKVAVLYNNGDAYSTGIAQAFIEEAKAKGLEVVSTTTFPDDTNTDFSAQLNDARNNGAEMVFMPIYYTPASLILAQAASMSYAPIFFGGDGMDGILVLEGFDTKLAENLMLMTPFNASSDDEKTASFVKVYQEKYNEVPNQFAADGYDSIYAIYEACKAAGITADMSHEETCEKMVAEIVKISMDGLTGKGISFSANGEVSKAAMVVKVVNGAYVNQ